MGLSVSMLNKFLMFKLPAAFICGVRVKKIQPEHCVASVKHRWINQNPFNSMYFAVQAMAAELTTGALVMYHIRNSNQNVAMLILSNKSSYTKKATGRITFTCNDGNLVTAALQNAISTRDTQSFWMKSIGINEQGVQVSQFEFEWSVKPR